MTKNTLPSLEKALTEISSLIETMEKGNLTLEQSLAHFEQGIKLIKHAQKTLQKAEQKVQILIQKSDQQAELEPYEHNENSEK